MAPLGRKANGPLSVVNHPKCSLLEGAKRISIVINREGARQFDFPTDGEVLGVCSGI